MSMLGVDDLDVWFGDGRNRVDAVRDDEDRAPVVFVADAGEWRSWQAGVAFVARRAHPAKTVRIIAWIFASVE